jgi:DNA invertase Pin-like site-specific DNA recombinase
LALLVQEKLHAIRTQPSWAMSPADSLPDDVATLKAMVIAAQATCLKAQAKARNAESEARARARVSTDGQTAAAQIAAAQIAALEAAGAAKVYAETASGARGDRAKLALLLRRVEAGDTVLVTRLDRLARSTRDLLNVLHRLGERKVAFKSLGDAWADTTTPQGRLMLAVLGGIAEFERELIRARTGEGRKRAMAKGVKFGRPRKLTHQRQEALKRIADGETYTAIARSYAVDPNTISRLDRAGA